MNRSLALALAAAVLSAACSSTLNLPPPVRMNLPSPAPSSKIWHVIVMLQENRSFNNLFMSFPGADTSKTGRCLPYKPPGHKPICNEKDPKDRVVDLKPITLETCGCLGGSDIEHSHSTFLIEYDNGAMDGFDKINRGTTGGGGPALFYPYAYVVRREVQPYWDMATRYSLADHMFSTATTDSFVAHQQIIAGTTRLNSHESLVDTPSNFPWGCDAPKGTVTGLIFSNGKVKDFAGPFPCLTQYHTMADVLDAGSVSWKFYVASYDHNSQYLDFSGEVWDAFDAIKRVRYGTDWKNVSIPNTNIFGDIKKGMLPQVSWVIPHLADSDHPASGYNFGPAWVSSVVNAVGKSPYWRNTAIIVLWDDWGGYYDNVPPPQLDYTSLGMRVPMIVISPFAKKHYVSKTQYEFGSVLKFIEQSFGTASLGSTDVRANSIGDIFDFSQPMTRFVPIDAPYPQSYFLREREPSPSIEQIIKADGGPPD